MWSSCVRALIGWIATGALTNTGAMDGRTSSAPPESRTAAPTPAGAAFEEIEEDGLIEVGSLDEMVAARERFHGAMRGATQRLFSAPESQDGAFPDAEEQAWIGVMTAAAVRALRQEAVRRDRGAAPDASFSILWNEMADVHLQVLRRWPRLWREDIHAEGSGEPGENGATGAGAHGDGGFLPAQLLLLCSPEAYEGESFSLPRDCLVPRMATLPESLAACCIDPARCAPILGASCTERLVADVARTARLDALVGYRNGARYWTMPPGVAPRGRANDAAVARAQGREVMEMIAVCDAWSPINGLTAEALTPAAILSAIPGHASRWFADANPFVSVPGLRNPRCDATGRLICDITLAPGCLDAMPPLLLAQIRGRLAPDARIIATDSGRQE